MLELLNPLRCRVLNTTQLIGLVRNGKPFPEDILRCQDMGDPAASAKDQPKRVLKACPLCGERLKESPRELPDYCPSCEFNLNLVISPETLPVPYTEPAYVPNLVYWLVGTQMVISAIFAVIFLFFAAPVYLWTPQLIAAIQLMTMVGLGLFAYFLHRQKGESMIRLGLLVLGVISLPPGVCTIAAALAISSTKRICITCGKSIGWSGYIDCPHCQVSMHRFGSCRKDRLHSVVASTEPEMTLAEIEFTCPNCHQFMHSDQSRRKDNE